MFILPGVFTLIMANDFRVSSFVPSVRTFNVEDTKSLNTNLNESYRDLSQATNQRTIGNYTPESTLTGNKLYGVSNSAIPTYRVFLSAPSILNGTTSIPHNVQSLSTMKLLTLFGGASSAPSSWVPLPFVNVATPGNGIQLQVNGSNVEIITTSGSYTGYSAWVVMEYSIS